VRIAAFLTGIVASVALLSVGAGCSDRLETGYAPRKLNSSASQRRAYYAPAFSPEASPEDAPSGPMNDRRPTGTF
jgi:hypothetical protein